MGGGAADSTGTIGWLPLVIGTRAGGVLYLSTVCAGGKRGKKKTILGDFRRFPVLLSSTVLCYGGRMYRKKITVIFGDFRSDGAVLRLFPQLKSSKGIPVSEAAV